MQRTITHSIILGFAILISSAFSSIDEKGKIHLKVSKEENGYTSVFEKIYSNMNALISDEELKNFDDLVETWADEYMKHTAGFTKEGDATERHIVIKQKGQAEEENTFKSDEDSHDVTIKIDEDGTNNMIWIDKDGNETKLTDEHIEELITKHNDGEAQEIHKTIKVITSGENDDEQTIKVTSDGEENEFTIKAEGNGTKEMIWIDEDGNKTKMIEKDIEVFTSDDEGEEKNVFVMKNGSEEDMEIEVDVEKEIDKNAEEKIIQKKIWVTKDGNKVELDDNDNVEFEVDGDHLKIEIDDETLDLNDFSEGNFEADEAIFVRGNSAENDGSKQTMNININEENGEKFIEIDIKRTKNLNVTISEIQKDDAALEGINYSIKDKLKPSKLNYYPNPNNGRFNLKFILSNDDEVIVKVIDILGNEVYKEKIRDFKGAYDNQIDLTGKKKGIYILQISQKKKVVSRKILIE